MYFRKSLSMMLAVMTLAIASDSRSAYASGSSGRRLAVVWNDLSDGTGWVGLMDTAEPWDFTTPPLDVGANAIARFAQGVLYVVSRSEDTITAIDPVSWSILHVYTIGEGSEPLDIAVVDAQSAYVTRRLATHLLRLDLDTGATSEATDLSTFADSDGVPDMGMMAVHEGRLFVQIRRQDTEAGSFVPPAYLAVVDIGTEQIIDVDPVAPGVQAIELAGTEPKLKMQVVPETRRLFVSATGEFFDAGGIEMIDLDSLQSLGLVVDEQSDHVGADLGAFVLVTPERGYLTFSTDFAVSSHMVPFTLTDGADAANTFYETVGYYVPTLVHDEVTETYFFPQGAAPITNMGVHVFEALDGTRLTADPIGIDGFPTDMELVCPGSLDCNAGPAIPAMSGWGMALMATIMCVVGGIILRTQVQRRGV